MAWIWLGLGICGACGARDEAAAAPPAQGERDKSALDCLLVQLKDFGSIADAGG